MKYLKDEEVIRKFGQKLKELREIRGLSQEAFSLLTEISQSQIARTELGKVNTSISHAAIYAKHLNVMMKDLFDF